MRENKKRTIALAAKVLGGIAFMAILLLNVMVVTQKDGKAGYLSVTLLKSYADSVSSGSGSGSGSTSGSGSSTDSGSSLTTYYLGNSGSQYISNLDSSPQTVENYTYTLSYNATTDVVTVSAGSTSAVVYIKIRCTRAFTSNSCDLSKERDVYFTNA